MDKILNNGTENFDIFIYFTVLIDNDEKFVNRAPF